MFCRFLRGGSAVGELKRLIRSRLQFSFRFVHRRDVGAEYVLRVYGYQANAIAILFTVAVAAWKPLFWWVCATNRSIGGYLLLLGQKGFDLTSYIVSFGWMRRVISPLVVLSKRGVWAASSIKDFSFAIIADCCSNCCSFVTVVGNCILF